jgi:prepilin-type N-terminal cleavage/methylation domain-containing protein/prepilin-type processing-associated H-X9-DG protein
MFSKILKIRAGFTLIELLVVISIIALLMAILMPALSKVRAQAGGIVCRTHFKDLGLMLQLYMEDSDGVMVSNQYGDTESGSGYGGRWPTRLGKYYERHNTDVVGHDRYNTDIFYCPSEWRKSVKEGGLSYALPNHGFMYELNGFLTDTGTDNYMKCKFRKSATWKEPHSLPVMHDTNSDVSRMRMNTWDQMYPARNLAKYGWKLGNIRAPKEYRFGPAANHGRGINYLFADMHVEMTMWPYEGTLANPEPKEYYYRLWHPLRDLTVKTHE